MAEFVWEARARTGEVRKGAMEAESEEAVNQRLRSQQLQPTKVKKKAKAISFQLGSGVGQNAACYQELAADPAVADVLAEAQPGAGSASGSGQHFDLLPERA